VPRLSLDAATRAACSLPAGRNAAVRRPAFAFKRKAPSPAQRPPATGRVPCGPVGLFPGVAGIAHENKGLSVSKVPRSGRAFSKRGNAHHCAEYERTGNPRWRGWEATPIARPQRPAQPTGAPASRRAKVVGSWAAVEEPEVARLASDRGEARGPNGKLMSVPQGRQRASAACKFDHKRLREIRPNGRLRVKNYTKVILV
jgi:hypothetical protein